MAAIRLKPTAVAVSPVLDALFDPLTVGAQGPNRNLACHFAKNLDLEDKKRDFTDAKIHAEVGAELQRRGL